MAHIIAVPLYCTVKPKFPVCCESKTIYNRVMPKFSHEIPQIAFANRQNINILYLAKVAWHNPMSLEDTAAQTFLLFFFFFSVLFMLLKLFNPSIKIK